MFNVIKRNIRDALPVLVMCLSSSQIFYAFICQPNTLSKSFYDFLKIHSGARDIFGENSDNFLKLMGKTIEIGNQGESTRINHSSKLPIEEIMEFKNHSVDSLDYVLCSLSHGQTTSCVVNACTLWRAEFFRALKLNGPITLLMAAIYKRHILVKTPNIFLKDLTRAILRSSAFLSFYGATAWYIPCVLRHYFKSDKTWFYRVNGIVSGSMLFLESPSKRVEIALYCFPRAIESFWNDGVRRGWFKNIKNGEILYFSLSAGVLMTLFDHKRDCVQIELAIIMDWFIR